jgi:CheY-like chemotaxis protein
MMRILIADDDEVARLHMGSVLEGAGHEVCYAADGEQAVQRFEQGRHDLVIVDLAMPVKNGIIAIREIRGMDKFAKVLAVSGESPEQFQYAEEAGALQTLEKPVPADELLDAVAALAHRATGWDRVYG